MGLDSYLALPSWIHYQKVLSNLSFIEVVNRDIKHLEQSLTSIDQNYLQINSLLQIHHLDNNPYPQLSSTILRQKRVSKS